jgi:hypothetical protein
MVSTTQWSISLFLLIAVTCLQIAQAAMTDPATGIAFAPRIQEEKEIVGVGVRKKGPIKVHPFNIFIYINNANNLFSHFFYFLGLVIE